MRDYNSPLYPGGNRRISLARHHWLMLGALAVLVGTAVAALPHTTDVVRTLDHKIDTREAERTATGNRAAEVAAASLPAAVEPTAVAIVTPHDEEAAGDSVEPPQATLLAEPLTRHTVVVKPGDSLSKIFARLDLSPRELHDIVRAGEEAKALSRLKPGQQIYIDVDGDNRVQELLLKLDWRRLLSVSAGESGYQARTIQREIESQVAQAQGIISSSLYDAAQNAGVPDNIIMELVGVFGWDIDFALDIRSGDSFAVVFEENYLDGKHVTSGPILAAEFVNRGKVYRVVRYTDPEGNSDYYSPDGRSARKAFLRMPVSFARISSRFGRRHHPVLNRMRMHKGVDYAAPSGTPIKASGDGKVVYRGRKGGYGRTVILQHGGKYTTLYAHMSSYRRGVHVGKRVRQGDVIGYVGSSGLASGPHLHYEFRVNGVHRNPLTVRLPEAKPVREKWKDDFATRTRSLIAQLEQAKTTQVALNLPTAAVD